MALKQEIIIIISVCALAVALVIIIVLVTYMCLRRRRAAAQNKPPHYRNRDHHNNHRSHQRESSGRVSLGHLPTAAETKRMDEGNEFVSVAEMRRDKEQKANSEPEYNFIMGPAAEISERDKKSGIDNVGFAKENQIETGAYLRGGVDPADVAEAFMEDEFLKEASRPQNRRQEQLQLRKKHASSKKNRQSDHRRRSSEKSTDQSRRNSQNKSNENNNSNNIKGKPKRDNRTR